MVDTNELDFGSRKITGKAFHPLFFWGSFFLNVQLSVDIQYQTPPKLACYILKYVFLHPSESWQERAHPVDSFEESLVMTLRGVSRAKGTPRDAGTPVGSTKSPGPKRAKRDEPWVPRRVPGTF